jgi:hypothetical protein
MKKMSKAASVPTLAKTISENNAPTIYIFNRGNNNGYFITAADDVGSDLLGYTDEGSWSDTDIAPTFQGWLDELSQQISYASAVNWTGEEIKRTERTPISIMLTTKWGQSYPFYNMCPQIGSSRCLVGCVATAAAQVMKYHNWPAQGTGSYSYDWSKSDSETETLSIDFSECQFDWDNMINSYTVASSQTKCNAVALLMKACGYAVDMAYGTSASSAVTRKLGAALVNYFGYDKGLTILYAKFYTGGEWEDVVYSLLADGPVIFDGRNSSSGHCFVCDGYSSDGFFHFNWGWTGTDNGYYRLTALNTSSYPNGYNLSQYVIGRIKPAQADSDYTINLVWNDDFGVENTTVNLGTYAYFTGKLLNNSITTVDFYFCLKLKNLSTNEVTYLTRTTKSSLKTFYQYTKLGVILPLTLSDGTYKVTPAYKLPSSSEYVDIPCVKDMVCSQTMLVANRQATFSPAITSVSAVSNDAEATDVTYYTTTGVRMTGNSLTPGTYIKVTKYSNGSCTSSKVIIK